MPYNPANQIFQPISGSEMGEIALRALALLAQRLRGHPGLQPHLAYPRFTLRAAIEIIPWDSNPVRLEEVFDDVTAPQRLRRELGLPQIETVRGLDGTFVDRPARPAAAQVVECVSDGPLKGQAFLYEPIDATDPAPGLAGPDGTPDPGDAGAVAAAPGTEPNPDPGVLHDPTYEDPEEGGVAGELRPVEGAPGAGADPGDAAGDGRARGGGVARGKNKGGRK